MMFVDELSQMQRDALGLRKNVALYESTYQAVDETTGQILRTERKQVSKVSKEPDFIKIYYKVMMAFADVHQIPLEFLLALSEHFTYSNGGGKILFTSSKLVRETICQELGIKDGMYKCYLRRCCEQGVLFPVKGYRGAYEANPWLIAKGRWESISLLQASFDFVDGKWRRIIADPPEAVEVNPPEKLPEPDDHE